MAKIKCPNCAHLNEGAMTLCSRCQTALPHISFEEASKNGQKKRRPVPEAEDILFRRGQVVNNRYTVLDLIGRGGMGCIYKVHDNVLGEDLALKTLLPQYVTEKMVVDRFLNEARITRKLAHPNIVRVHDIGMTGKGIYISMEYVQGDSLRGLIEKQRPGERIPVRQALHIIDQLCIALEYAHQYTIHRDIKPENVMITQDNHIKLMDFGISKLMDDRYATSASMVMGTPYYMSPEQLRSSRDVDARADIYSIGVVLYEILTGNMPTGVPRPASEMVKEVPPALDGIVSRCVEPELAKRFQSAAELRAAIRPIIEMLDEAKDPLRALSRRPRATSSTMAVPKQPVVAVACILVAVATVLGGLWMLDRWNTPAADLATVATTLATDQSELFAEITAMIEAVRDAAASIEDATRFQRERIENAEMRWRDARDYVNAGDAMAVRAAEETLQYYLAALIAPESMVFVPPGHVTIDNASVYVPAFFMERTEVTLRAFEEFCLRVDNGWPAPQALQGAADSYPDHPVSYVAWFDAQAYAAWKDNQLPTHAQWARAAYGDTQSSDIYPWGDEWKADAANLQSTHTRSVRSFSDDVVWSGCYDMAGNVMEWTRTPAANTSGAAPPTFGDAMIVCGGSYLQIQPLRDVAQRAFETRAPDLGFRCVREIETSPESVAAVLRQANQSTR